MEAFFVVLIFFAIITITAVVFFGWLMAVALRGLGGMLFGLGRVLFGDLRPGPEQWIAPGQATITCPRPKCRTANPAEARFCRRCGYELPAAQRVSVRRAAML